MENQYVVLEIEINNIWGAGKLRWIANQDRQKTFCNCIHIKRQGRWGNNVYQLMHVLQLATISNIKMIFVPKNFMFFEKPFMTTNEIEIRSEPVLPGYDCIYGKFYVHLAEAPPLNVSILDLIRDDYLKLFPDPHLSKDTLVMHIRSGDVFQIGDQTGYAQPPCKYYETVMRMRNWSHVEAIASDLVNPCTKYVMNLGAHFETRELRKDLGYILNAENLVLAKGTFGVAGVLMSKKVKRLYTYNDHSPWMPDRLNCEPTKEYRENVIGKWRKTKKQFYLMEHSPGCDRWISLNRSKPHYWYFANVWYGDKERIKPI